MRYCNRPTTDFDKYGYIAHAYSHGYYDIYDERTKEYVNEIDDFHARIAPLERITLSDNREYTILMYPYESDYLDKPHFHLHIEGDDYANDICVRIDCPEYFYHNCENPLQVPGDCFAVPTDYSEPRYLTQEDKRILNEAMRTSPRDPNNHLTLWKEFIRFWNVLYDSDYPSYKLDIHMGCPNYNLLPDEG